MRPPPGFVLGRGRGPRMTVIGAGHGALDAADPDLDVVEIGGHDGRRPRSRSAARLSMV
jgi:hypothetical protein